MAPVTVSGLGEVRYVISDDGRHIALDLVNADGTTFRTALNEGAINQVLGASLEATQKTATKVAPPSGETREITSWPVPAARLGVARGRSDTEAFLAVQLGIASITFAVELSTLLGMRQSLGSVVVDRGSRQPN